MKYDLYRGHLHTAPDYSGQVKVFASKYDAQIDNPEFIAPTEMQALLWLDDQPEGFVGSEDLDELNKAETVTPKYPNHIMARVRQKLGLEEYDTSKDSQINGMSKDEVFRACLEWEGIIGYEWNIRNWVEEIFGVKLRWE